MYIYTYIYIYKNNIKNYIYKKAYFPQITQKTTNQMHIYNFSTS